MGNETGAERIGSYINQLARLYGEVNKEDISRVIDRLFLAYEQGRQVFTMGNGGYGSIASHFVNDLAKHTVVSETKDQVVVGGKRFRAFSLNDSLSVITAWANDLGYEHVFSQQLAGLVSEGDVVIGFTGSGNSANILNAFQVAKEKGATTIAITGEGGGQAKDLANIWLAVPSEDWLLVEDVQASLTHLWTKFVREMVQEQAREER